MYLGRYVVASSAIYPRYGLVIQHCERMSAIRHERTLKSVGRLKAKGLLLPQHFTYVYAHLRNLLIESFINYYHCY